MEKRAELLKCLEEKIYSGKATVHRLKPAGKVDGVEKLIRKIQQEIRFLEKVRFIEIIVKTIFSYRCIFYNVSFFRRSLGARIAVGCVSDFVIFNYTHVT